jgi:uncharacterized repeat protein (TIGR03806 family)
MGFISKLARLSVVKHGNPVRAEINCPVIGRVFPKSIRVTKGASNLALIALLTAAAAITGRSMQPSRASKRSLQPYGLTTRPISKPYLRMPQLASGRFPPLLSQTGAFENVRTLTPNPKLIPYELIVPFWSDGANKFRWISLPKGTIQFTPDGEWAFPNGTVFVKQFDLPTDETNPTIKRRLETRLLVRDGNGGVYGVTYKWRADNGDADLLDTSVTENITIKTGSGTRNQAWYYPSREDCLTCHTSKAGGVLGVKARQMNRDFAYPSGVTDNELRAWNHVGLFDSTLHDSELAALPKLANANDNTRSLEDRARSFLDVNCSQCHRPEGTVAAFDARYDIPLAKQGLIGGPVLIDEGIDRPRIVAPNDPWRSILVMRVNTTESLKMPPLARTTIDCASVGLLRDWIHSLPGPTVLDPPVISPPGGSFHRLVTVTLADAEPGATLHYTLDGSEPTTSDPIYEAPLQVTEPKVIRARAFKQGFTRSIAAQQIYIPGE